MPKKSARRPPRVPSSETTVAPPRRSASRSRQAASFPVGAASPSAARLPTPQEVAETELPARLASPPPQAALPRPRPSLTNRGRPIRGGPTPVTVDYHYVLADLRRIGLLALVAFVILGGLTLVIH